MGSSAYTYDGYLAFSNPGSNSAVVADSDLLRRLSYLHIMTDFSCCEGR